MALLRIPASCDADKLARAIAEEEACGHIFRESQMKNDGRGSYNEALFEYYLGGHYPPEFVLAVDDQPAPKDMVRTWQGRMLVAEAVRQVRVYRERANH